MIEPHNNRWKRNGFRVSFLYEKVILLISLLIKKNKNQSLKKYACIYINFSFIEIYYTNIFINITANASILFQGRHLLCIYFQLEYNSIKFSLTCPIMEIRINSVTIGIIPTFHQLVENQILIKINVSQLNKSLKGYFYIFNNLWLKKNFISILRLHKLFTCISTQAFKCKR